MTWCSNTLNLTQMLEFFMTEAAENKRDCHRSNCSHIRAHKQKRQTREWKRSSQNPQRTQGTGGWYSFSLMDMKLKLNTAHTARHRMQKLLLLLMQTDLNLIWSINFHLSLLNLLQLTRKFSCMETQEAYLPRRSHSPILSGGTPVLSRDGTCILYAGGANILSGCTPILSRGTPLLKDLGTETGVFPLEGAWDQKLGHPPPRYGWTDTSENEVIQTFSHNQASWAWNLDAV